MIVNGFGIGTTNVTDGNWYMVTVKRVGTSYYRYTNGVLSGSAANQPTNPFSITRMMHGNYTTANILIYGRGLSEPEILSQCQLYSNRFPSGQACAP